MNIVKMSLHRVIAEIKNLEAKLSTFGSSTYVSVVQGEARANGEDAKKFKAQSEALLDSFNATTANLAALKAARNKANAITPITIGGKIMTIDEALAAKAVLPEKERHLQVLQRYLSNARNEVDKIQQSIETKVEQQITALSGGTRKVTEDEIAVIRKSIEGSNKGYIIAPAKLEQEIEKLKKEIETFKVEVDFVLSEANATTTVEVVLI